MPLDASWMDAIPAAQPTATMLMANPQQAPAAAPSQPGQWTPPPGVPVNNVPVIDVTAAPHPGAAAGQPGSQLAPSHVDQSAPQPPAGTMAIPTQQPSPPAAKGGDGAAGHDTSWMDAIPAVQPTAAMQMAQSHMPGPKGGGVVANIGAGTSEAVANTLGAPVDWAIGALNAGLRGAYAGARALNSAIGAPAPPAQAPQITNPVGGSDWIKSAEGLIGADPRNVQAPTAVDQLARAGGNGAASMLLPWAGARALPELAGIPGALQKAFGAGTAPTMTAAGFTGGVAGKEAADSAPAPLKPLASLVGNMVGGGPVLAGRAALDGAWNAAAPLVQSFVAPMREGTATGMVGRGLDTLAGGGRQALAGQRIAGAATDAAAVREALENPASGGQIVPGSQPTTYQLTGDQGLGNLERVAAKNAPDEFIGRAAQQNMARVRAVGTLAPENASPEVVGTAFRQHLAALDAQGEAATNAARSTAQQATQAMGGAVPVGSDAQTTALQSYGERLRGGLDAANEAARQRVGRLSDLIDPDNNIAMDMSGIRTAAQEIIKGQPVNAEALEGKAAKIFGTAQMLPKVQKFRELEALRHRITDEMRAELYDNGRTNTYRLLTQLLKSVDETLTKGVEDAAARDGGISARLEIGEGSGGPLAGGGSGQEPVEAPSVGAPGVPGQGGTQGAGQERPGSAGGDSAVAPAESAAGIAREPDLTPNFTSDVAARYRARNAAHIERVQTFEEPPGVGRVLATGKRAGEWKLGDSQVAATIFNSGKGAAERAQAFLKAGGDNQALRDDLTDYAAFSLRRAAEDADGTLDAKKANRWLDAHAEALHAFPEVAAKFRTAVTARAALDDAVTRHAEAREAFEKSAASHFLGDADPVRVMGKVLRSDRAQATMQELARMTASNPAARAGLQRAAIDHILGELRTNATAGDTAERAFKADVFQTFVRRSEPALRQIFEPGQVQAIRDVATDLQRAQRSVSGTKLPGGSNTAQDLAAGEKHGGGKPSVIGMLVAAEAAGEVAGHAAGPVGRAVGMIAVPVLKAMREKGMRQVDDLVTEAMLHPELARALLAKVPPGGFGKSVVQNAARQILALSGVSAVRSRSAMEGK